MTTSPLAALFLRAADVYRSTPDAFTTRAPALDCFGGLVVPSDVAACQWTPAGLLSSLRCGYAAGVTPSVRFAAWQAFEDAVGDRADRLTREDAIALFEGCAAWAERQAVPELRKAAMDAHGAYLNALARRGPLRSELDPLVQARADAAEAYAMAVARADTDDEQATAAE